MKGDDVCDTTEYLELLLSPDTSKAFYWIKLLLDHLFPYADSLLEPQMHIHKDVC